MMVCHIDIDDIYMNTAVSVHIVYHEYSST